MPVKKNFLQVDFSRGMVEHIEGDASYQDSDLKWQIPQSVSALYVENYDPTQIIGSLTKRSGMYLTKTTPWTDVAGLPDKVGDTRWPSVYVQQGVIKYDADNFTGLALLDPSHSPLLDQYADKCTILGGMNVDYNRPVGQNILLTFLRDATESTDDPEKTRIVSYVTHLGNAQATTPYYHYNAHINGGDPDGTVGAPVPADYPGWDIRGTLSDATRHGGSVVLTTNIASELPPFHSNTYTQDWAAEMYPCYVWSYWDISRKRDDNEYYNNQAGTILADLVAPQTQSSQYGLFKVLWPSMYATRNEIVGYKAWYSSQASKLCTLGVLDEWAARSTGYTLMEGFFADAPATPIELSVIESPARNYDSNATDEQKLPIATDGYGDFEYQYFGNDTHYVESIETLRQDAMLSKDILWDYIFAHDGSDRSYERMTKVMTVKGREYTVDIIGIDGTGITGRPSTSGHMKNPERGGDPPDLGKRPFWVYGVRLPNYVSNGNPRSWLMGEKIPLVVTAKIRGVEVKIGEFTHIVGGDLQSPYYPSLFQVEAGQRLAFGFVGPLPWNDFSDVNNGYLASLDYSYDPSFMHPTVADSIYYRILDAEMKIDGHYVEHSWATWRRSVYNEAYNGGLQNYWRNEGIVPHFYEPWNPTGKTPFVINPVLTTEPTWARYEPWNRDAVNGANEPRYAGYRPKHNGGKHIWVTFRIRKDALPMLIDMGMEALNVYVVESDPTRSQLRSMNVLAYTKDVPPLLYGMPKTTSFDDLTKFRLVKTFLIDGKGKAFADVMDYEKWKDAYRGAATATNAWHDGGDFITASAQDTDGTQVSSLTPDFILWDYGTTNKTLSLNSSGEYWQGRGAGMVANIKGRTFLSGCVNRYGEEEQGIIRYSDVQSGVLSLDVFSDESYLKVGGLPHTALVEYREQLWAFSRSEVHRIQLPNVADPSSWEYLDKFSGQGTYCPKTTVKTPFGVAWCNDGGVWISDGRMPDNIAVAILGVYQTIATGTPWPYTKKVDLGHFPIENGQNPYLELAYDEFRNELVVITPYSVASKTNPDSYVTDTETPQDELRLIYNFDMRVWRVETYLYPEFGTMLSEFNERGVIGYDQLEPAP